MNRRRVWAPIWAAFGCFALLRASGVQWSVAADSLPHGVRIAAAYAIVVPIVAYAVVLLGKRLRFAAAAGVLDAHVLAVAWLHHGVT
nr:hypothetical protein [Candidatus Eremiobacteraeota bacterium]